MDKEARERAEAHMHWLLSILEVQHRNHMIMLRKVAIDEFVHGEKHGFKRGQEERHDG